jgi:hypothetical protein
MVVPGADRGIDKTSKEEEKADEQNDPGHATVKSVSFSHTGCLVHKGSLNDTHDWAVRTLRHSLAAGSIVGDVKFRQKKDDVMLYKE